MSFFGVVAGCATFAAVLSVGLTASAETPLEGTLPTMDPRPIGMGMTLRAAPGATAGIYLNPATIAMAKLFHLELMYQHTGEDSENMGGLAVVDSITTIVAAGLSFNYARINKANMDHESYDGRLALAGNFADVFFVGLTGRYLRVEQNMSRSKWGPNGRAAMPSSGSHNVDGFTFDAGLALKPVDVFSIGVVGYNLTDTGSIFAPVKLGSGLSVFALDMITVEGDVVIDFTSFEKVNEEIHAGAEILVAGSVPLRGGYIYDVYYGINSVTAGIGYVGAQFALDFGYMQEVIDSGRWVLSFGFKYFIN
ncbi:MAG: hypothetical protein PHU25_20965 [Deltaproteobacteria bacterium]|nr:hypothetical protein [Deltaproteobacteria bacterium]